MEGPLCAPCVNLAPFAVNPCVRLSLAAMNAKKSPRPQRNNGYFRHGKLIAEL